MAKELPKGKEAVTPAVDISADIERFAKLGVLGTLLADRSNGGNIIWASNVFSDKGESFAPEDEIFARDITGDNAGIIRTRASKDRDDQVALTRAHAEVFTPLWIVHKMVDWADEAWYEAREASPSLWQQYVRSPRLEITCGEAPYLVSRYDAADGTPIPVDQRCGVLARKLETFKAEDEKRSVEDTVRANLRGFARTIPSFLMAYGDEGLTLANFDDYTEDDVFLEVTGITEDEFRFLRDGGDYFDEKRGRNEHFAGGLFDETVFNDSVREFLNKRAELADYFDESHEEDIFDYIPPQKTNQIFTPRWVVRKMVDALEEENPGCFDDPDATFADLYMKSGLYITEVVKRLYASEGLRRAYPDEEERINHILQNQVYGMAPTRIIYLIATNYILGFDEGLRMESAHFVEADAAEASKNGTLRELVVEYFGE